MEHIVLQWDDILERLWDELVQEEVQELNRIEIKREGYTPPEPLQPVKHEPWRWQDY